MKKSILALALGGAEVAVGVAVKNAVEKKKEHNSEEYFAVPDFLYNKTAVLDVLYKHLPEGVVIKNTTNPNSKGVFSKITNCMKVSFLLQFIKLDVTPCVLQKECIVK